MTFLKEEEVLPAIKAAETAIEEEMNAIAEKVETKPGMKRKLPEKPAEKKVFLSALYCNVADFCYACSFVSDIAIVIVFFSLLSDGYVIGFFFYLLCILGDRDEAIYLF